MGRQSQAHLEPLTAQLRVWPTTRENETTSYFGSIRRWPVFSDNAVTVRLPESAVLAWATTERVSLPGEQVLDDGAKLTILVEKDFVCLTSREGEDESDMYPHPEAGNYNC